MKYETLAARLFLGDAVSNEARLYIEDQIAEVSETLETAKSPDDILQDFRVKMKDAVLKNVDSLTLTLRDLFIRRRLDMDDPCTSGEESRIAFKDIAFEAVVKFPAIFIVAVRDDTLILADCIVTSEKDDMRNAAVRARETLEQECGGITWTQKEIREGLGLLTGRTGQGEDIRLTWCDSTCPVRFQSNPIPDAAPSL